jgi:hypothetical protein
MITSQMSRVYGELTLGVRLLVSIQWRYVLQPKITINNNKGMSWRLHRFNLSWQMPIRLTSKATFVLL